MIIDTLLLSLLAASIYYNVVQSTRIKYLCRLNQKLLLEKIERMEEQCHSANANLSKILDTLSKHIDHTHKSLNNK